MTIINSIKDLFFVGANGLTISLSLETEASLEGTASGNLTVGVEYYGGKDFRLVKDFQKTAFTMVAKLSGKVGIEAKLGITDIPGDIIEGYVFAEVGGAGEVKKTIYTDNSSCTHAALYMYAEMGAKLSVKLGLYTRTYEDAIDIWDDDNSPWQLTPVFLPGKSHGQ